MWTADEIKTVLGAERAGVFGDVYGVQAGGNCNLSARSDPHQEFSGKNVLMQVRKLILQDCKVIITAVILLRHCTVLQSKQPHALLQSTTSTTPAPR